MFLTGRGTLASCSRQEGTRDKRVPVAATGSGPLAGKLAPEHPEWSGCQSRRRRVPARVTICCRKRYPFQGPKLGSCLTLGNELSEETHVLTKQEILLEKGIQVESSRVRKPRRTALPCGLQCQYLWWFWEVDGHTVSPLDLSRTLPVGGGLLVPCSLPGPPVVTMVPGQGGKFQSVCFT